MAVTVSGDNTVSISITEANAIAVDVGQVQQSGVTAYGGIGPTIVVSGTHTAYIGTIGINPFVAGPNITVTQSAGNITISGRDPQTPTTIVSVTGGGGDFETLADDISEIKNVAEAVIAWQLPLFAPVGIPLVSGPSRRISTASSYVSSVMGRTGTVTLTTVDITGASGARCGYDKAGSVWSSGPFYTPASASSVNDLGGSIVLSTLSMWDGPSNRAWFYANKDEVYVHPDYASPLRTAISAANSSHTHGNITASGSVGTAAGKILVTLANGVVTAATSISTTQITNFTATAGAVKSVNGQVGDVTIGPTDIGSTLGNDNLGVDMAELQNGIGAVEAKFPVSAVPAGRVLVSSNEGNNGLFRIKASAGFVHSISGCTGTVTINAGTDIKITKNVSDSSITVSYTGAGGGGTGGGGNAIWPALILGG